MQKINSIQCFAHMVIKLDFSLSDFLNSFLNSTQSETEQTCGGKRQNGDRESRRLINTLALVYHSQIKGAQPLFHSHKHK